jgi:tRNA threonylcarbamoyladenosine biosynthesis protein TsaB
MPLILNIDTATEYASACLSRDGELIAIESNPNQKDHAAFIQPAIKRLLSTVRYQLSSVDAIAVSNGPGSYTGLRVGLSTAKGLCYALDKPLLLVNTLEIIATSAIQNAHQLIIPSSSLSTVFCPMIDARRMEVFTAVYDEQLKQIELPAAKIIDANSFSELLSNHNIIFSGSGAEKFEEIVGNNNAYFLHAQYDASHMATIAENLYLLKSFADKAYSEPYYLKEFFTPAHKLKSD